jgi:hypothetical protein
MYLMVTVGIFGMHIAGAHGTRTKKTGIGHVGLTRQCNENYNG